MDKPNNGPENQLQIELSPQMAEGKYANLAILSHSHAEFIADFARVMPGMPKAPVVSRIILAPEHAKRLLNALAENVGKYESQFGRIMLEGAANGNTFNLADMMQGGGAKS